MIQEFWGGVLVGRCQEGQSVREAAAHTIDTDPTLATLLLGWQSSGDESQLTSLIAATRPLIRKLAASTLHKHGIGDPAAMDDVVSRVFDHLRRLPGISQGERIVTDFATRADGGDNDGLAYIVWLTRNRTIDIVRSRHRRHRWERCFSAITQDAARRLPSHAANGGLGPDEETPKGYQQLIEVIPFLESRERAVIELLLDGKSQVVIAQILDVCEGTVSRLRVKAIASIRSLLAERLKDPHLEREPHRLGEHYRFGVAARRRVR